MKTNFGAFASSTLPNLQITELIFTEEDEVFVDFLLTAQYGSVRRVLELLEQYPEFATRTIPSMENETALHGAAAGNRPMISRILLDHGADVNAQGSTGETPFRRAVWAGNAEVVHVLLEYGADRGGAERQSALIDAAGRHDREDSLSILLEVGADATGQEGLLALHDSIFWGSHPNVTALLQHDADVNGVDEAGIPMLHIAIRAKQPDLVPLFIEYGADVNILDKLGHTPLHVAAWAGARQKPMKSCTLPIFTVP